MKTTGYGLSDIGLNRKNNEDFFLIDEELKLYMVCDGMGGHTAGEIAAREAADAISEFLRERKNELAKFEQDSDVKGAQELVVKAFQHASRSVHDEGIRIGHPKMGTTVTVLLAVGDRAVISSVGDSRAYHCRKKSAKLLTNDHTLANELLIAGEFSPEQAKNSPFKHFLTRTVGMNDDVEVDTLVAHLVPGDIFLLCTDGLTQYFDSQHQLGEFMFNEPSKISPELVAFANSKGGKDNVTVLVVHVKEDATYQVLQRSDWQKWFTRVAMF